MRRSLIGVLSVVLVTALAVVAAATGAGTADASSSSARGYSQVKFALDYRGTISGTWRNSSPVVNQGFQCKGHDLSGSFTSTVRPGSRRQTVQLYKDLGGRKIQMQWKPNNPMGVVSSNRTAQGWMMVRSGGQCRQVPKDESGCGAHTFNGLARLEPAGGSWAFSRNRAVLSWEPEPETIGCDDGMTYDHRIGTLFGQHYARFVPKTLYLCGIRKGRRCRFTIGATSDYPFQVTQNEETYTSNVHTEWSVTFRVISRR